ncbi:MAG: DapH/DapD/GlmU-related protein [Nanoarchaeota archaeon]|nr:DapH/DapD/GlmU-related protein [Nanoarchaeota archaeon]
MKLMHCSKKVLNSLRKGNIYQKNIYLGYYPKAKKIIFSKERGILYDNKTLECLFETEEIRTVAFHNLGSNVKKATHIANFSAMLYNRIILEVAKKIPLPKLKNRLLRKMKINIEDIAKVIVAPNVFMDYIYPELISIKPNVFIGEEAVISSHYFTSKNFTIGYVNIEEDCLIGARSIILPGVTIKRGTEIGLNAIVARDTKINEKIRPCQFSNN